MNHGDEEIGWKSTTGTDNFLILKSGTEKILNFLRPRF